MTAPTSVNDNWQGRMTFKLATSAKEEDSMIDFINQHFVSNEPLTTGINMCEAGYRMPWFDKFVRKYISENLSLMAIDSETGELMGVAVCTECKGCPETCDSSGSSDGERSHEEARWAVMPVKFGLVLEFLEDVVSSVNILGDYGVDRYLELFMLSTHSTKRCPGLGTEMVRQTLLVAKQKGFPLCVTEATSFFSQKIFTRLGFHVIKEVKYEDYKPHGKVVFPAQGMHDTLKLMAKRIE